MIKTMKYKIQREKHLYDLLRNIQYVSFRMKNKAVTMAWDWQQFSFSYNNRFAQWPKEKATLGRSLRQDIYHTVKEWNEGLNSLFCDASVREALKKFQEQKKKVLNGEQTLVTYKRNSSFPIRSSQIGHIRKKKKGRYIADFSLLSSHRAKEYNGRTQMEVTLMSGASADVIMDRIIEGTYQLSDSRIIYHPKKRDFFLLVSYQLEKQPVFKQSGRIMGVDLGIHNPAAIAISDVPYALQFVGDSKAVEAFDKQIKDRKRRMQKTRKWSSEGSVGHGTKTRLKPFTNIKQTIANYKERKNHQWSRYIIDYAIKNGVERIQMEDLTGIATTNKFLKNWPYYNLQQKIQEKAAEVDIDIIKVAPQHTSARCHHCGAIHRQRDESIWRKQWDTFNCMNCNYQDHADANAAKNITMKDIDQIIEHEKKDWFRKFEGINSGL